MKAEDHIHFLSELLYHLDQLLAFVREYCDEVVRNEEEEPCQAGCEKQRNIPF